MAIDAATRGGGPGIGSGGFDAFIDAAENHFAGSGLVHGSDNDIDHLVDQAAGAIDDYHGAVAEIGDALHGFLAFALNEDMHGFAGEDGGLKSIGQFIDV